MTANPRVTKLAGSRTPRREDCPATGARALRRRVVEAMLARAVMPTPVPFAANPDMVRDDRRSR